MTEWTSFGTTSSDFHAHLSNFVFKNYRDAHSNLFKILHNPLDHEIQVFFGGGFYCTLPYGLLTIFLFINFQITDIRLWFPYWLLYFILIDRRESLMKQTSIEWHVPHPLVRQISVHDVENEISHLCPKVEGRIFQYDDEVCYY